MAPEVLTAGSGESYRGQPADVWSAAVVLFTLVVGHPPFEEASRKCWFFRKACVEGKAHLFWAAHAQSAAAAREPDAGGMSDDAKALLLRAFAPNPRERAPRIKAMREQLAARRIGGESPRGVEEDSYA